MREGREAAEDFDVRDWGWKHFFRIRDAHPPPNSPAERLMTAFDRSVTARTLAEGLHSCELEDPAESVSDRMNELDFDALGVRTSSGGMIGYVEREKLGQGTISEVMTPFVAGHLISDSAPLYEVMIVLERAPRVFVLGGPSVYGIVTRGDLQKEPVRVFIFALVTMLEMQLSALLRRVYPADSWQTVLSAGRIQRANELFEARIERNEQIGLFDCLQLCDKRDLLASDAKLRGALGFSSKRDCVTSLKMIEALRDRVAHAQDLVAGTDWPATIRVVESMDLLLQRAAMASPP